MSYAPCQGPIHLPLSVGQDSAWEARYVVGKSHASASALPHRILTILESWLLKPGAGDSFHLPCCIRFLGNMFLLLA